MQCEKFSPEEALLPRHTRLEESTGAELEGVTAGPGIHCKIQSRAKGRWIKARRMNFLIIS